MTVSSQIVQVVQLLFGEAYYAINDIGSIRLLQDGYYFLRDKFACCLFEDALPLHVVDLDDENFEKGCQSTFDLHMENIDISFA